MCAIGIVLLIMIRAHITAMHNGVGLLWQFVLTYSVLETIVMPLHFQHNVPEATQLRWS